MPADEEGEGQEEVATLERLCTCGRVFLARVHPFQGSVAYGWAATVVRDDEGFGVFKGVDKEPSFAGMRALKIAFKEAGLVGWEMERRFGHTLIRTTRRRFR
jgi:hypothetical protein